MRRAAAGRAPHRTSAHHRQPGLRLVVEGACRGESAKRRIFIGPTAASAAGKSLTRRWRRSHDCRSPISRTAETPISFPV